MAPQNKRTAMRYGAESKDGGSLRSAAPGALRGHDGRAPVGPPVAADSDVHLGTGSAVVVGTGMAAVACIPVPGTNGLFIELKARGWVPKTGSTSTLFIQDGSGKRHLRLDYGYNVKTNTVDYHWNQKGTYSDFGIADHTPSGDAGEVLYRGARTLRYAGRVFLIAGLAMDLYSIVVARKRWRQVARVTAGWAGSWAGCESLGAGLAAAGTAIEPGLGTAIGGGVGCIAGGIAGYAGASWAAGHAYDWVEESFFDPVPDAALEGAGR
jgi:hypothetical protein